MPVTRNSEHPRTPLADKCHIDRISKSSIGPLVLRWSRLPDTSTAASSWIELRVHFVSSRRSCSFFVNEQTGTFGDCLHSSAAPHFVKRFGDSILNSPSPATPITKPPPVFTVRGFLIGSGGETWTPDTRIMIIIVCFNTLILLYYSTHYFM